MTVTEPTPTPTTYRPRSFARLAFIPRDHKGNVGSIQILGRFDTPEEAQSNGLAHGAARNPGARLWWRQFSPTTWGLMAGQLYTNVLVSWCEIKPEGTE